MYYPKRFKYKITHKTRKLRAYTNFETHLFNGECACKPTTIGIMTSKHMRRLVLFIKKLFKRANKYQRRYWIPYFPHTPIFKKSVTARMGKGKGKRVGWQTTVYPNLSYIESRGVRYSRFKFYIKIIISRLGFKVTFRALNPLWYDLIKR